MPHHDVPPQSLGAFCQSPGKDYDGMACEFNHSTCGGTAQDCHGRGPGFRISDFESNRIIGEAQFQGAQTIMKGSLSPVSGAVRAVHVYMNMYVLPERECSPRAEYNLNVFLTLLGQTTRSRLRTEHL
jgi:hypothetical protein